MKNRGRMRENHGGRGDGRMGGKTDREVEGKE